MSFGSGHMGSPRGHFGLHPLTPVGIVHSKGADMLAISQIYAIYTMTRIVPRRLFIICTYPRQ